MIKTVISILSILIFLTSCVSTTTIKSNPSGAKVYINGEFAGETPYEYKDTKISWSSVDLTLKKEGYNDLDKTMHKNEEVNFLAVVGGFVLLVPFLWTMEYKDTHTYELSSGNSKSTGNKIIDDKEERVEKVEKVKIKALAKDSDYPVMLKVQGKIKISDDFRDGVEEVLTSFNYSLVDEKAQAEALKNQSEQRESECYDDSCLVDTGKMLAAKALIVVRIDRKGKNSYKFKARFIDFEKGTTQKSVAKYYEFSLKNYKELMNFGKLLTKSLLSVSK